VVLTLVSTYLPVFYHWFSVGLVRYGILEFNVPLDTVYVISETGKAWRSARQCEREFVWRIIIKKPLMRIAHEALVICRQVRL